MKKALIIIGSIVAVIVIVVAVMVFNMGKGMKEAQAELDELGTPDMTQVEDGTYTGEASEGLVKVVVEVTVKDHKIDKINLVEHQNGKGEPAEAILDTMVTNNTTDVDAVSGATLSSVMIKTAVNRALMEG